MPFASLVALVALAFLEKEKTKKKKNFPHTPL